MKKLLNTLYVTVPDAFLLLDGENVVLQKDRQELGRVPLHNLERILAFGYRGVSPALMGKCIEKQIEIVFLTPSGKFLARVEGGVNGNVLLRREQYRIADDQEKSLTIARNMVIGKIYNSRQVIMRMLRDHAARVNQQNLMRKAEILKESLQQCQTVESVDVLRGIEGESAAVYFSVFDEMILQNKTAFSFTGRKKRPPTDPVNALLSFSYSLCTSMCASALEAVGLDPYVGFMHTDRPGRRSLALDLVEEFRAWHCDRFVTMLINKKIIQEESFEEREDGATSLNDASRKAVLNAWQTRKQEVIRHPFLDEKIEWGMLPYVQALLLARHIRGDLDAYPPFMWK